MKSGIIHADVFLLDSSIVYLQYCVSFWCTAKRFSYMYTYSFPFCSGLL